MSNVGQSIPHDSAVGHVTGRALFLDDLPLSSDELHVGFVGSPAACGAIEKIDIDAAKQIVGVVGIYTADDIPGEKCFGIHYRDEPVLAMGEVLYVGQPVVVIAAETKVALERARRAVKIEVRPDEPILSIEEAIEQKRFLGVPRQIRRGNPQQSISAAPHRLSGIFHSGGQEQFYLESQAAIAYPGEDGQLIVHSSTQNTTEIQIVVAEALRLGQHQVVCICKRMGGAFGGKETQAAIPAILAALVAHKTGRAARLIYNKDEDMISTGKRHAYRTQWEVGFDPRGRIVGLRTNLYSNCGATADLSMAVLERSMLHAENAYYIPNIEINGRVCFTNLPPNTAFRGFGGPQGMAAMENVIHAIASHLGLDPLEVQQRNLYGTLERNFTPYGQHFRRNHLPKIVSMLAASSSYTKRREEILVNNAHDPLRLRGIALSPMKFGISFTTKFLNQANALVNLYTDGTVQVSTGATEMGQGVNTKIRQLVADEFGLDWTRVLLMPTSTEKNNNTSPTAASASTDLNGAAAIDACRKIKQRLTKFAALRLASTKLALTESQEHVEFADGWVYDRRRPEQRIKFGELCKLARLERIDLGARGFFATPGIDFNRETGQGTPFFYYTQGAAVAEVEIDRFTGELTVPRVDLLIDIGRSINPGVDRGQVIGGFIQGMGWVTAECLVYNEQGTLLSHSPTTYKIPASTDVPRVFNCAFFDNDDNVENIRRSKAVGEPPLMLAIAVWGAVKQVLSSMNVGSDLRLPATSEEILRCLTLSGFFRVPVPSVNGSANGNIDVPAKNPVEPTST
ncbi:MAG: xanthine dehydrogenase molybdopterin binding subunit [Pirellulales bacterium]